MSSEIEAMDCGDATESTGEDRQGAEPAPTAEKEKVDAGSPSVAEIIPAEPTVLEEKGKPTIEDDVEMADPKSEEPPLMDAEDNPAKIVSDKSEVEVACGSPVEVGTKTAEELAPVEIDSDSSVEVIDSPVKSPPSNKSGDERKKAAEESPSNALAKEEKNEEAELADSSIELISSPTSEDSAGRDQPKEGKKQEEKKAGTSTETSRDAEQEMKGSPKPTEPDDALEVKLEKKAVEVEQKMDVDQNNLTWDGDIFYGKDCVNCNCKRLHKQFVLANMATLNFYKVTRKVSKQQFVCTGCSDAAMEMYEQYAGYLMEKQPLLLKDFPQDQDDFVALDSSDEEEEDNKVEEKPELSTNDLKLVENELEDAIATVLNRVGFKDQLSWSKSILVAKAERLERHFELAEKEMEAVQSVADKMHWDLYTSCTVVHKHLPPLDLQHNIGEYMQVPPAGEIERPPIQIGETYYAVKNKAIASWVSIKVIEFSESTAIGGNTMKSYKIKYLNTPYQMVKTVTAKHIAYFEPPPVRLTIGTRVIAYFDGSTLSRGKDKGVVQSAFYPGIIAEPLKQANRFRYLIFYDDGYTQYVQHRDVRLVCQASEKVWEDVHPASRDFIQKYVEKYSVDRPMVQCTRGQSMNTESNGTWLYARVIDIDCSLVLMHFEAEKNHTEWIYRGSLRLGPVFKETQNALSNANAHHARVPRRTEPFIRYTKEMESSNMQVNQQMRAMARKSSSVAQGAVASAASSSPANTPAASRSSAPNANRGPVKHLNNSTIYVDDENRPKGHVVYFTAKRNLPPKIYRPHECNSGCLFKIAHRLDSYSPLAKPLLSGWERLVLRQKTKKNVVYRGPCGKSLRSLGEVHYYLRKTENVLNVDNFDFTPDLKCLAEYSIDPTIVKEADISKGQEKMAIPLVNYYDNSLPPPCTYAKQRIPTEGVHLNLDEEFLVGCDCDDDCSDKSKCSCWQLTVAGVKYCNPKKPIEEIGYQYKRLHEHVPTGIYECNSRCKCKKNCLNRVVQHSLEMKLQVFKTSNRGWGLRCVNDIPKGAFICIYAGHLLTETMANEGGQDAGDEYFADLDYIEVAEQLKEGYESEVEQSEPEPEEDSYLPEAEDDDDFRPNKYYQKKNKVRATRSISASGQSTEVDSQERAVINFNPNADLDETVRENSVRRLFGKDEAPYIMDAKTTGNLGRYFNHSCNPNLFVQNVFVDTHDLRFPWVAFFSASHIRSGTELTWNYNYEVGVVPGKVLYCQCGAPNCRIRLL